VLVTFQDAEDALVAFSRQQAARDRLADAVTANKRASELARNLYAQGLTDFLTVLVELIALYKALGGGWQVASGSP